MEAILINHLPALPLSPSIPVLGNLLRSWHSNFPLQFVQSLFCLLRTTSGSDPGKPSSDVEVVFTRLSSTDEPAVGKIRGEDIEDERAESVPVRFGLFEEVVLHTVGDLGLVD